MTAEDRSADESFAAIVEALADRPGVTPPDAGPTGGGSFGSSALRVHDRIFAMVTRERLVLKLPARRVAELIGAGVGEPFDAGKGRPMKEWVALDPAARDGWLALASEALAFVGRSGPRPRPLMAHDEATTERVRRVLAGRPNVVEKRMIGGRSFSLGDRMCCGVVGTAVMVRVGADARESMLARPHVRPMILGGRVVAGFVLVDPPGVATDEALTAWVQRGIDFVEREYPPEP